MFRGKPLTHSRDHFDSLVEDKLRRSLPIITTPYAKECLVDKKQNEEAFTAVYAVDTFQNIIVDIDNKSKRESDTRIPAFRVVAMPGEHVPPGILKTANNLLGAVSLFPHHNGAISNVKQVPPTNSWMLELGTVDLLNPLSFESGYRIYISGDTLMVDKLNEIPERYKGKAINLMLVHLSKTTIPGPLMPLLIVTIDTEQGVKLMQLINPKITIPIHYNDYNVLLGPLEDFRKKVDKAGLTDRVVYLDRKDQYKFKV